MTLVPCGGDVICNVEPVCEAPVGGGGLAWDAAAVNVLVVRVVRVVAIDLELDSVIWTVDGAEWAMKASDLGVVVESS